MANHQPVYHHLDGVLLILVQLDGLAEVAHLTIHTHAHIAGATHILEDVLVFALARTHQRRQQHQPCAIGEIGHGIYDLLDRLLAHFAPALWAVGMSDARIEQAHIVVYLGDGAHCRTRIVRGALCARRTSP